MLNQNGTKESKRVRFQLYDIHTVTSETTSRADKVLRPIHRRGSTIVYPTQYLFDAIRTNDVRTDSAASSQKIMDMDMCGSFGSRYREETKQGDGSYEDYIFHDYCFDEDHIEDAHNEFMETFYPKKSKR